MVKSYTMLPNLKMAHCQDRKLHRAVVDIPTLQRKKLLLVHHRVDRVTLNRKPWVVCCGINAHVMTLHVAVRSG